MVSERKARCWFGQRRASVTAVEGNAVSATTKGALHKGNVAPHRMFRQCQNRFGWLYGRRSRSTPYLMTEVASVPWKRIAQSC